MNLVRLAEKIASVNCRDIPEGKIGDWEVERFEITKWGADCHNLRCSIKGQYGQMVAPGTYTRLVNDGITVMSDTPAEIGENSRVVAVAKGDILINGLGLGWVVKALMVIKEVEHVTVIEISSEVIQLVGKYLLERYPKRLTIIQADALEWKPPKGHNIYDCVWHDIWNTICATNYESMKKLHRKYGRKCRWQGSWQEAWVRGLASEDRELNFIIYPNLY